MIHFLKISFDLIITFNSNFSLTWFWQPVIANLCAFITYSQTLILYLNDGKINNKWKRCKIYEEVPSLCVNLKIFFKQTQSPYDISRVNYCKSLFSYVLLLLVISYELFCDTVYTNSIHNTIFRLKNKLQWFLHSTSHRCK